MESLRNQAKEILQPASTSYSEILEILLTFSLARDTMIAICALCKIRIVHDPIPLLTIRTVGDLALPQFKKKPDSSTPYEPISQCIHSAGTSSLLVDSQAK